MARINNDTVYFEDPELTGLEALVGSDANGTTRRYPLTSLKTFFTDGISVGSGTVSSVFGRTGDIVAAASDYNTFFVDLTTAQTVAGNKTFSDVTIFNGKTIVGGTEFGPTAIGSSVFRATSADFNSINIKEAGVPANTSMAIFSTKIIGSDGYVSSFKNFVDDVFVYSLAGVGNADITDGLREVETTIGLRNDYTGGQFTVIDLFNQDYPSGTGTEIRQKSGIIAIHGGGAPAKPVGLWRYDTTTYTRIWELDPTNNFNISVPTDVDNSFSSNSYSVNALNTAPASATATGTLGEIRWTATHVYLCTATDTWVRAALSTWV